MANNKKISEFPLTTLSSNDIFLINHLNTTSTVTFDTLSSTISQNISTNIVNNLTGDNIVQKLSTVFIKKPTTATNGQILTYNGSTWVASNVPTFSGFGSGYLTGIFLSAGTNMSFTVPNGVKKIEITAVGSGGKGGDGSGSSTSSTPILGSGSPITPVNIIVGNLLKPIRTIISDTAYKGVGNTNQGGAGWFLGIPRSADVVNAAGGGAGGWVKKTLNVSANDVFTYTTGISYNESTISKGSWSMTAREGGNGGDVISISNAGIGGAGGTITGDYDEGYTGQSGQNGGTNTGGLGGIGRDIYGNLGGTNSEYSGYIFVRIVT
jgi:hypothetical protein